MLLCCGRCGGLLIKAYALNALGAGPDAGKGAAHRKADPMEVRLKSADRRLGPLFPLAPSHTGVMGVLPSA